MCLLGQSSLRKDKKQRRKQIEIMKKMVVKHGIDGRKVVWHHRIDLIKPK